MRTHLSLEKDAPGLARRRTGRTTFFVAEFSAGYTTNMFGFDLRQGQVYCTSYGVLANHTRLVSPICPELATNRTWPDVGLESAFGGRAEVEFRGRQVR